MLTHENIYIYIILHHMSINFHPILHFLISLCQDTILGISFSKKNNRNCPQFQRAYTLAAHEAKIIIFKWNILHL